MSSGQSPPITTTDSAPSAKAAAIARSIRRPRSPSPCSRSITAGPSQARAAASSGAPATRASTVTGNGLRAENSAVAASVWATRARWRAQARCSPSAGTRRVFTVPGRGYLSITMTRRLAVGTWASTSTTQTTDGFECNPASAGPAGGQKIRSTSEGKSPSRTRRRAVKTRTMAASAGTGTGAEAVSAGAATSACLSITR